MTQPTPQSLTLIGLGRWGSIHFKKWTQSTQCCVIQVVDLDSARLNQVFEEDQYPSITFHTQLTSLIPSQIISVATPISTFKSIITTLNELSILAHAHVLFIEKPGGADYQELMSLVHLQKSMHTPQHPFGIWVGYLERFNPCVTLHLFPNP
jgi:predicted dehydrogenase